MDGSLYYEISGSGPVLAFAHGIGGNHRSWWQQVSHFSAHYTCLTFSHRGFVPSHDDTGKPRPHLFAQDLAALLDHLDFERVAIIAQSMGGWTALEFALHNPERVTALVLSATTGTLRHPGLVTLAATGADARNGALRARGVHPAAGERMAREQPELHRLFVEISRSSGEWDRDALRRALDGMRVRDPHELQAVTCPVLALAGAEDVVCPPANVRILAGSLPHANLAVVPRAGHSVYFERPAMFNEAVLNFLRDTEAAR
jgi:pimeloyl-ACP methyl ester carboxylesterase